MIHGGKDYRLVETEGLATFQALQRQGVPSKFLLFPEENHWCLNLEHSLVWHQEVFKWIEQWTAKAGSEAAGLGTDAAAVPVFTGDNSYRAEWKTKARATSRWASPSTSP